MDDVGNEHLISFADSAPDASQYSLGPFDRRFP